MLVLEQLLPGFKGVTTLDHIYLSGLDYQLANEKVVLKKF